MAITERAVLELSIEAQKAKEQAEQFGKKLEDVSKATDKATGGLNRLDNQLDETQREMGQSTQVAGKFGEAMRSIIAGLAVGSAFTYLFVQMNNFNSVMIEVQNTTGVATEGMRSLEDAIVSLNSKVPSSISALSELVNIGSQLGFVGDRDLTRFAEVMTRIGAVTDLKGAQAARSIATFLRAAGEPVDLSSFERIGGAVNTLSDATGATGAELVGLGQMIVQLTERFGLGTEEALAYAAALSRTGASSGASAIILSRMFSVMDDEFVAAFGGDRVAALQSMIGSLKAAKEGGEDLREIMSRLGLQLDGRTGRAVLAIINSGDDLTRMLKLARDETANLKDLTEESDRAFESIANQTSRFWENLSGLSAVLTRDLAPAVADTLGLINDFVRSLYISEDGVVQLTGSGYAAVSMFTLLSAAAGAVAITPLVQWLAGVAAAAKAAGVSASTILMPALGGVLAVTTALVSIDVGRWLYDEFRLVQEAASRTIGVFEYVGVLISAAFETTFAVLKDALFGLIDTVIERSLLGGETLISTLYRVGLVSEEAYMDFISFAATATTEFDSDLDAATDKIATETEARLAFVRAKHKATMDAIANDFNGTTRKNNESYFDYMGTGLKRTLDDFKAFFVTAQQSLTPPVPEQPLEQAGPPSWLAGDGVAFDGLLKRLDDTKVKTRAVRDETVGYKDQLDEMMQSLILEEQLIGKSNDERERAQELAKAQTVAAKAFGLEQAKNNLALAAATGSTRLIVQASHEYAEAQANVNEFLDEYVEQLERVQRARGRANMDEMRKDLETEARLIGASSFVQENASRITEYHSEALRAYGGDVAMASDATSQFVESLGEMEQLRRLADIAKYFGDEVGGAFEDMLWEAKSFEDALEDVVKNVAKMVFNTLVTQQIAGFFTGLAGSMMGLPGASGGLTSFFGGGRAAGGPVQPGGTYVVGEEGPEILRLGMNGGYVTPNHIAFRQTATPQDSSSSTNVNMTVYANDAGSFMRSQRQIMGAIRKAR